MSLSPHHLLIVSLNHCVTKSLSHRVTVIVSLNHGVTELMSLSHHEQYRLAYLFLPHTEKTSITILMLLLVSVDRLLNLGKNYGCCQLLDLGVNSELVFCMRILKEKKRLSYKGNKKIPKAIILMPHYHVTNGQHYRRRQKNAQNKILNNIISWHRKLSTSFSR